MKGVVLRQFEIRDQEAVCSLHERAMKLVGTYFENTDPKSDWDKDIRDIENIYIKNNGEFYVATVEDDIVAMGALGKVDDNTAEVKRMRVEPSWQGKGIGKLILGQLIHRAKELGYSRLILDVAEKQKIAQHLYESLGFKEFKREEMVGMKMRWYELSI